MSELEQAIDTLLDLSASDLVRFSWGHKGTTFQEILSPMSVFDGRLVVSHLCKVHQEQEVGLAHLVMYATPDPNIPESIFRQGSGVWCETYLPVLSTLYWLAKGHPAPSSPYEWRRGGRPTMQWFFEIIDVTSLTASTLLNSELPGVLPLIPFTQDVSPHIIELARRQLPTAAPQKQVEGLESLLLFFWAYVQSNTL